MISAWLAATPLCVSALRRLPAGRARAIGAAVSVGVLAALLATLIFGLVALWSLGDVTDAIDASTEGFELASDGDQDGAAAALGAAEASFDSARGKVGGFWALPARLVPIVGQHVRAVQVAASEGVSLTQTAVRRRSPSTSTRSASRTVPSTCRSSIASRRCSARSSQRSAGPTRDSAMPTTPGYCLRSRTGSTSSPPSCAMPSRPPRPPPSPRGSSRRCSVPTDPCIGWCSPPHQPKPVASAVWSATISSSRRTVAESMSSRPAATRISTGCSTTRMPCCAAPSSTSTAGAPRCRNGCSRTSGSNPTCRRWGPSPPTCTNRRPGWRSTASSPSTRTPSPPCSS